ncbi:decarboxylating NADP(+)-dependent phosphogluconate dehydrogenase [Thiolapillus sp.]
MEKADIGLIGLAVMGQNLALNMSDHGFRVAVYNRTTERMQDFVQGAAAGTSIVGAETLEALVDALQAPRKIMLMVRAGKVVDAVLDALLPLLAPGDIVIDGGNSKFTDTDRRVSLLASKGMHFIGCGVSGGEEGARHGPAIMPGGDAQAWPEVRLLLQSIAAEVDGVPCCQWIGSGGAGHYVKMAHNGIEYGDMQLIAEAYHLLREGLGMDIDAIQQVFTRWNQGVLNSYLIEITANILAYRDEDGEPLLDRILDSAGQKGTGKWTGISALELGVPLTLIGEAVFARCLSAFKEQRQQAQEILGLPSISFQGNVEEMINAIEQALYASKIVSYAQGYMLMKEAAQTYGWDLHYSDIALVWRGGCIIRSRFLDNINQAYVQNPGLDNLLLDDFFVQAVHKAEPAWRKTCMLGVEQGIPLPAMSAALSFFDGYRRGWLPANLIQAQRDYFGAHTYERLDRPRGEYFHTDWSGQGGDVASGQYDV